MNTKDKGETTQAVVIAELMKRQISVSIPFGDNQRYDLIVDINNKLYKVQCKTACIKKGCLSFRSSSSYAHRDRNTRDYKGEVDYFAVWCPDYPNNVYFVNVNEATLTETLLRMNQAQNGQLKGIRWGQDYLLDNQLLKIAN